MLTDTDRCEKVDFLYFLIGFIVTYPIFSIVFQAFNDSVLRLCQPAQRYVRILKRKRFFYNLANVLMIFVSVYISEMFLLNRGSFGVLLGILMALVETVFDKNMSKGASSKESINE